MSLEIEGAINRLTAAVLALAVSVEKDEETSLLTAEGNVESQYEKSLSYVLSDGPE